MLPTTGANRQVVLSVGHDASQLARRATGRLRLHADNSASSHSQQPAGGPYADVSVRLGLLQFHVVARLEHQHLEEPAAGVHACPALHHAVQADAGPAGRRAALQAPLLVSGRCSKLRLAAAVNPSYTMAGKPTWLQGTVCQSIRSGSPDMKSTSSLSITCLPDLLYSSMAFAKATGSACMLTLRRAATCVVLAVKAFASAP